ncbi:YolD-like family protein [Alteribacillus bidgolensis]|uniref:YolD-like protein n=1 Tax=Alteribacillus bidgolensis TaxID=930129 RepID=A0A1G8QNS1_9BACI|nr:YolD-like family protein [Alteribacillus bidgolensis]SDJ06419.1 YolD-like protein [Alteribacillus bidgolensis]
MRENIELTFTYWDGYDFYEITGCCHYINHDQKQFNVKNKEKIYYITFDQITNIRRQTIHY